MEEVELWWGAFEVGEALQEETFGMLYHGFFKKKHAKLFNIKEKCKME